MTVIAIVGGRTQQLSRPDRSALKKVFDKYQPALVVSGGATGIDTHAVRFAEKHGIETQEFPADWNRHGKAAGFIRNKQIVDACDLLIALPGGKGTANSVSLAHKAKKKVLDWR